MYQQYKEEVAKYTKKDALIALCLWIFMVAAYSAFYLLGQSNEMSFGVNIVFHLVLTAVCIATVLLKKEKLSSIGFRRGTILPSLGIGLVFGILAIILYNGVLAGVIFGRTLRPFASLAIQLLYFIITIALTEEVVFRGYIQTRLYGLFKSDVSATLVGALLFMLIHVPSRLISGALEIPLYYTLIGLGSNFLFHIVFNCLYIRHNAIFGAVVFHALSNWASFMFVRESTPLWPGISATIFFLLLVTVLYIIPWHRRIFKRGPDNFAA